MPCSEGTDDAKDEHSRVFDGVGVSYNAPAARRIALQAAIPDGPSEKNLQYGFLYGHRGDVYGIFRVVYVTRSVNVYVVFRIGSYNTERHVSTIGKT